MDVLKDWYLELLKQGWTLNQIDEMDIGFFFELMRHKGKETEKTNGSKKVYIDELPL